MNPVAYIAISVMIAAVIGGVTNYLAIKMLFHPRRPVMVWGKRLPFTPGLIPARRDELARALGQVVGDYLVTSAGLKQVVTGPEFRQRLVHKLQDSLNRWAAREGTIEDWFMEIRGEERWEGDKRLLLESAERTAVQAAQWLWEGRSVKEWKLERLVPGWNGEAGEKAVRKAADYVIRALTEELLSARGDLIVRRLAAQLVEQAGGWLGALAGIFMDEHKLSARVRAFAASRLQSPVVRSAVEDMIRKRMAEIGNMTLEEAAVKLSEGDHQDGVFWLESGIRKAVHDSGWLDALLRTKVSDWKPLAEWLHARIPGALERALDMLGDQMDRIVQALRLPKMVEEQVSGFPIVRLEEVVLGIAGKEFRMITWLGALLGGIIGLGQSLFILWWD